jgi:hypothetical protein
VVVHRARKLKRVDAVEFNAEARRGGGKRGVLEEV